MNNDTSTLERLKNLDNADKSLAQKLAELEKIVKVPLPSRTEYALKWLLKTLQENPEARHSTKAWQLLAVLLDHSRPMVVTRLLKTDPESASRLLAGFFDARLHSETTADDFDLDSGPAIRMWRSSCSALGGNEAINKMFAQNCLLPAVRLLLPCEGHGRTKSIQGRKSKVTAVIERLIAKHVFQPAKSAYDRKTAGDSETDSHVFHLDEILSSVTKTEDPVSLRQSIPLLLSIAVRSIPCSTPKSRLVARPWLEAVFVSLTGLLQLESTIQTGEAILDDETLTCLRRLLDLANTHKIQLSRDMLRTMIRDYGGLSSKVIKQGQWQFIAAALAVDGQAIVDDIHLCNTLARAVALNGSLDFHRTGPITGKGSVEKNVMGDRRKSDDESCLMESVPWCYERIVSPLMMAFASIRDVMAFVRLWHGALVDIYQRRHDTADSEPRIIYALSVWEDFRLRTAFSNLLERSITSKQILSALDSFQDTLSITELDVDSRHHCFASALIMQSIFCGCSEDETKFQVSKTAHNVFTKALGLIFSGKSKSNILNRALWRLTTTTFQLWASNATLQELEEEPFFKSRQPRLARCSETFTHTVDNLEALASFSSMLETLNSRHIECKNLYAGIVSALTCAEAAQVLASERPIWAVVLSKLPPGSVPESLKDLMQSAPQPVNSPTTDFQQDEFFTSNYSLDPVNLSQSKVEHILVTILQYTTASPNSTSNARSTLQSESVHASAIYTHFCLITYVLLTRHHRKLSGRYDILVPTLQSLLRCLFTAPPSRYGTRGPSFATEHPAWLTDNASRNPLQSVDAEHFARLLNAFCDPTPSSVDTRGKTSRDRTTASTTAKGRATSRANLTDPVRVARAYAGQYAPYILLSLCSYQLEGRFADEGMRDALRPGVFAMLDAIAMGEGQLLEAVNNEAVWGVGAGVRTVLRDWVGSWKLERGERTR